jgi:hypothetical protein
MRSFCEGVVHLQVRFWNRVVQFDQHSRFGMHHGKLFHMYLGSLHQSFQVVRLADRAMGPTNRLVVIRMMTRTIRRGRPSRGWQATAEQRRPERNLPNLSCRGGDGRAAVRRRRRRTPSRREAAQGTFTTGGGFTSGGGAGHLAKGWRVGQCFDGWSVLSRIGQWFNKDWYTVTLMGWLAHLHVFQLEAQQRNRSVVPLA